jgi:invasion protein IalB
MHAYKGLVKHGRIVLPEGAELPEGAVVTVTIGEAEYLRAKLRSALRQRALRPARVRLGDLKADLKADKTAKAGLKTSAA